jgi:hypothetical protein
LSKDTKQENRAVERDGEEWIGEECRGEERRGERIWSRTGDRADQGQTSTLYGVSVSVIVSQVRTLKESLAE